ncbi:hypothetical protein LEMLEM_LOCUS21363 [Lemmus lemmus]
MPEMKLTPT